MFYLFLDRKEIVKSKCYNGANSEAKQAKRQNSGAVAG